MIEKTLVNQGLHVFIDAYLYHDIPISRYASDIYIFCHSINFLDFRRTLPRYISLISIILT